MKGNIAEREAREQQENIHNFQDNLKNLIKRHGVDNLAGVSDLALAETLLDVITVISEANTKDWNKSITIVFDFGIEEEKNEL